jgi:prepilin-type N-terminal cleavage/methylation domain-containing protein
MYIKSKDGFTLAEVLITLLIIGIIASIVIPGLIADTQQAELKTAWKKTFSDFSQATKLVLADNGGSMRGLCGGVPTYQPDCLKNAYKQYLNYTKVCDNGTAYEGGCFHPRNYPYIDSIKWLNGASHIWINTYPPFADGNSGLILSNGQLVVFYYQDSSCSSGPGAAVDGYSNSCGWITIDVNGFKSPNTVGKDIFSVDLLENGIKPTGSGTLSNTCNTSSTGTGCSAQYLYN